MVGGFLVEPWLHTNVLMSIWIEICLDFFSFSDNQTSILTERKKAKKIAL